MMVQDKTAPALPTSADRLTQVLLQEELAKNSATGTYHGTIPLVGLDNKPFLAEIEAQAREKEILVTVNKVPIRQCAIEGITNSSDLLYLQYMQVPELRVLGVSREKKREARLEALIGEPVAPVVTSAREEASLDKNPALYLAQCLERRIQKEKLYDAKKGAIEFPGTKEKYTLDHVMSFAEAAVIVDKTSGAVAQWRKTDNPLITKKDVLGLTAADVFAVVLCDISQKKVYETGEIAGFFGVREQDIEYLESRDFFKEEGKRPATAVRRRFRESYDLVIDAFRAGSSVLTETVQREAPERKAPVPVHLPARNAITIPELNYAGESYQEAFAKVVLVHQPIFNQRLISDLITYEHIVGNDIFLSPKKHFTVTSFVPIDVLVKEYRRSQKEIQQRVAELPKQLWHGFQTLLEVSVFAAAVLYSSLEQQAAQGQIQLAHHLLWKDVQADLHFEASALDQIVLQYLKESKLVLEETALQGSSAQLTMADSTFAALYRGLTANWALAMGDKQQREQLLDELGYLTMTQAIDYLVQEKKMDARKAYTAIGKLKPQAVLGMLPPGIVKNGQDRS